MSEHASHEMHAHSLEAWRDEHAQRVWGDRNQLIEAFVRFRRRPLTVRQIKNALGFRDMNEVRPGVCAMLKQGKLIEQGSVICEETGKRVMLIAVPGPGLVSMKTYTNTQYKQPIPFAKPTTKRKPPTPKTKRRPPSDDQPSLF